MLMSFFKIVHLMVYIYVLNLRIIHNLIATITLFPEYTSHFPNLILSEATPQKMGQLGMFIFLKETRLSADIYRAQLMMMCGNANCSVEI